MRKNDLKLPVEDRGGYGSCVWGGHIEREIELMVSGSLPSEEGLNAQSFGYGIRLVASGGDGAKIEKEWIVLEGEVSEFRPDPDNWSISGVPNAISPFEPALRRVGGQWEIGRRIAGAIMGWAFYRFNTDAMKKPQPIRKEYHLAQDGGNLSTVLHTLYSESHPSWDRISETVKVFLPRVQKLISPIDEQGHTYAGLVEKGLAKHIGTWAMSDGTLFALALATALVAPQVPNLLAIEAPDTEIHPRLMEHIAEMLIAASERTQVLITTHSPYLLTFLPPESLVIVENRNGETVRKQVKENKAMQEAIKSLGAGRAWYAGHLGGVPGVWESSLLGRATDR